jgi:hypothetical protein
MVSRCSGWMAFFGKYVHVLLPFNDVALGYLWLALCVKSNQHVKRYFAYARFSLKM